MRGVFTFDNAREGVDSIFLAGPTPMPEFLVNTKSWRHDVLQILEKCFFDGDVYIPESRTGENPEEWTYSKQVDWEVKMLHKATVIMFWIPRDLMILPGFTTNIEFGEWMKSGKIVVGAPDNAPKVRYLQERCNRLKIDWANTLTNCVDNAVKKIGESRGKSTKTWFTADTHFGNERTLNLSRRPFKTVDEMSWSMIEKWNASVGDSDTVYHLGDFGDPKYIKHLRGATIFVLPGNYDNNVTIDALKKDSRVQILCDNFRVGEVLLIHEPEKARSSSPGDFFLFGHIHGLQTVKKNGLNVGTDCHNFKPIDMETVMFYKNAIGKHYDSNVFMDVLGNKGE